MNFIEVNMAFPTARDVKTGFRVGIITVLIGHNLVRGAIPPGVELHPIIGTAAYLARDSFRV